MFLTDKLYVMRNFFVHSDEFEAQNKRPMVAAMLAIFFGPLGFHRFYLKRRTSGLIFLISTVLSFGVLAVVTIPISCIEAIYYAYIQQKRNERRVKKVVNISKMDTSNFTGLFSDSRQTDLAKDNDIPDIKFYQTPTISPILKKQLNSLQKIVTSLEDQSKNVLQTTFDSQKVYKVDYCKELNQNQFLAATTIDGAFLVIAGAGSGKTRTLTYRVSYLLEKNVKPNRILLLTFTRKAANEMLDRVFQLTNSPAAKRVDGGTFHAFANRILRKHARLIGIEPNFTIIDSADSADAINLVRYSLNIKKKKNELFPNKMQLQKIISGSRNKSIPISKYVEKEYPRFKPHIEMIQQIALAYHDYKRSTNIYDYDDLLEVLLEKMQSNADFCKLIQDSYDYILVDEYQDTNIVQAELIGILAKKHNNIFVVGDDAQSIYAFRGANFINILKFHDQFPKAKVIKLDENYRSNQEILTFSNAVINEATLGYKKSLYSQKNVDYKPQVYRFGDELKEASWIADEIEKDYSSGKKLKNIAVLFRASYHSNYLQAELMKRNIPFVTVGGIKFIERKHIKDVMAYLRVTANFKDSLAWNRILTMIPNIGDKTAADISLKIRKQEFNEANFIQKKFYTDLVKLLSLLKLIKETSEVKEKISEIIQYYFPYLEATEEDAAIRKFDLDALQALSEKYKNSQDFINDFSLDPPNQAFQNKDVDKVEKIDDYVTLTTIHSAKGLEWNTVFVIEAIDGLLPNHRSLHTLKEIDEERRLFYVAITRAKDKLIITLPHFSLGYDAYFSLPSRFLAGKAKGHFDFLDK